MSIRVAMVSLFGDLARVSFYGERQGRFFRATQQSRRPGRHRGQQRRQRGVAQQGETGPRATQMAFVWSSAIQATERARKRFGEEGRIQNGGRLCFGMVDRNSGVVLTEFHAKFHDRDWAISRAEAGRRVKAFSRPLSQLGVHFKQMAAQVAFSRKYRGEWSQGMVSGSPWRMNVVAREAGELG